MDPLKIANTEGADAALDPKPEDKKPRRIANLLITPQGIAMLCTQTPLGVHIEITKNGIPPGARVVGCGWDGRNSCFAITVEHESFDLVPVDGDIPTLPVPEFRQTIQLLRRPPNE